MFFLGNSPEEDLASPCDCIGTMQFIHISCLEKWLSTSSADTCEICKFRFSTRRHSRSVMEVSIIMWIPFQYSDHYC